MGIGIDERSELVDNLGAVVYKNGDIHYAVALGAAARCFYVDDSIFHGKVCLSIYGIAGLYSG